MRTKRTAARRLKFKDPMTIYEAPRQKEALLKALERSEAIELDLGGVPEMDSAGFQLLVMARREAERQGHEVRIVTDSAAVREIVDFYHARDLLALPPAGEA